MKRSYPTDLTDAEWKTLKPHIPAPNRRGRPRIHSPRTILDAVFYVLANVPSVVAIVLTGVVFGRGALRKLLGRLLIWRVAPRWYLVVLLGPVALAGERSA